MPTPIPIIPPIPAPDAIYKNDLGKTLAAQNQVTLLALPGTDLPPVKQLFPPYGIPDSSGIAVPDEEVFGENVNNLLL